MSPSDEYVDFALDCRIGIGAKSLADHEPTADVGASIATTGGAAILNPTGSTLGANRGAIDPAMTPVPNFNRTHRPVSPRPSGERRIGRQRRVRSAGMHGRTRRPACNTRTRGSRRTATRAGPSDDPDGEPEPPGRSRRHLDLAALPTGGPSSRGGGS